MAETIETIIKWHKKALPNATLDGQIVKYNEEWDEYFYAPNDEEKLKELADIFIVAFGICRFDLQEGLYHISDVWELFTDSPYGWDELGEAIQNKMAENRKRTWKETKDGEYHHVEGEQKCVD